jgi:hypothetical protein
MICKNTLWQQRCKFIAKISINVFILLFIFFLLQRKRVELNYLFDIHFLLLLPYEYFILFLISMRIFFLVRILRYNMPIKEIYLITITTKFYQILLPSLLVEGVRGIKYFLAGLRNKYDIFSLLVIDRVIGFTTLLLLFLASAIPLRFYPVDRTMFLLLLFFSFAFVLVLLNIERIKKTMAHAFNGLDGHIPKKALVFPLGLSFIAQMSIMLKYLFIFYWIVGLNIDWLQTLYLFSASHLAQVVPISTGLFSVKDGFLFFLLHTVNGESLKALHLVFVLGSVEIFNAVGGGIIESMRLTARTVPDRKREK